MGAVALGKTRGRVWGMLSLRFLSHIKAGKGVCSVGERPGPGAEIRVLYAHQFYLFIYSLGGILFFSLTFKFQTMSSSIYWPYVQI